MSKNIRLGPKSKFWVLVILSVMVVAWFILGIYLHVQVVQSRSKVEQNRIETSRRQEFLRRGAQYKQDLQQRNQPSKARNVFDGR